MGPVVSALVEMSFIRKEESVVAWPIDLSDMETYRKVSTYPVIMLT